MSVAFLLTFDWTAEILDAVGWHPHPKLKTTQIVSYFFHPHPWTIPPVFAIPIQETRGRVLKTVWYKRASPQYHLSLTTHTNLLRTSRFATNPQ